MILTPTRQSWGGYLNQAYAIQYPTKICGLIISSGLQACSEATLSIRSRIPSLPKDMQDAIFKAEELQNFEDSAYKAAVQVRSITSLPSEGDADRKQEYYNRHVCKLNPAPTEVAYALEKWSTQSTVYDASKYTQIQASSPQVSLFIRSYQSIAWPDESAEKSN